MTGKDEFVSAVENVLNQKSSRYQVKCDKYPECDSSGNIVGFLYTLRIKRNPDPYSYKLDEKALCRSIPFPNKFFEYMDTDTISCIADDIIKSFNQFDKQMTREEAKPVAEKKN